jgi:hypothetical protein
MKNNKFSNIYEYVCEFLPPSLINAIELCSVPHSIDDELANAILQNCGNLTDTPLATWAKIKRQHFIFPSENGEWRFASSARAFFISRLEHNITLELHRFLKNYFEKKIQDLPQEISPQKRELEWRVAYHLAPTNPEEAIKMLYSIGENAILFKRAADLKGIIDLFIEQKIWLSRFNSECIFFEGVYEYIKQNIAGAERCFNSYWGISKHSPFEANAGYLLGVARANSYDLQELIKAKSIFEHSFNIAVGHDDKNLQGKIHNKLNECILQICSFEDIEFFLLDTSFLIPLFCDSDPLFKLSENFIQCCKKLNIKLFYASKTRLELYQFIKNIKQIKNPKYYSNPIIRDFLRKHDQIDWNEYIDHLDSWQHIFDKKYNISVIPKKYEENIDIKIYKWIKSNLPLFDFARKMNYNKSIPISALQLRLEKSNEHDAFCIALVSAERTKKIKNSRSIGPWFITYDNLLSAIGTVISGKENKLGFVVHPRVILNYFVGCSLIENHLIQKDRLLVSEPEMELKNLAKMLFIDPKFSNKNYQECFEKIIKMTSEYYKKHPEKIQSLDSYNKEIDIYFKHIIKSEIQDEFFKLPKMPVSNPALDEIEVYHQMYVHAGE